MTFEAYLEQYYAKWAEAAILCLTSGEGNKQYLSSHVL